MHEIVSPNYHVIFIHYPLGLFVAGTLIELFSFLGWRNSSFRTAGRWMILLGAILAVPTATLGMYALMDVAGGEKYPKLSPTQLDLITDHVWLGASGAVCGMVLVVLWLACSDRWRSRLRLIFLALALVTTGLYGFAAWHGGEAVYREGLAVGDVDRPAKGSATPHRDEPAATQIATTLPTPTTTTAGIGAEAPTTSSNGGTVQPGTPMAVAGYPAILKALFPPMQVHVMLAGLAAALGLVSLGLSVRVITATPIVIESTTVASGASTTEGIAAALQSRPELLERIDEPDTIAIAVEKVPASRFWLLACLLAIGTVAAGLWVLASDLGEWNAKAMFETIGEYWRRRAHVITGVAIVVLPIVLAILARVAPRRKILLTIFALLMVAALAIQVWLGTLLLFYGPEGSLTHLGS